jgi:RNA polymerase sigma factor (TIGR02999 family)
MAIAGTFAAMYTQHSDELDQPGDITVLLREWTNGDSCNLDPLFELVYPQLKQIANSLFRNERPGSVLQPTVLVNELYLKLLGQHSLRVEDRKHFFSLAARLMRRVLVDQARSEGRQKRSGGMPVALHEDLACFGIGSTNAASPELLDLDRVLNQLEAIDLRKCRMLEVRCFLGLTAHETAEVFGTSKATVDRDLRFVRSWLYDRLQASAP